MKWTEFDWWSYSAAGVTAPRIRHVNRLTRILSHWPRLRKWV